MRKLLVFFLILASFPTSASSAEHWAEEAARRFHDVLLKCPERIWPGMDWSRTQFLFASDSLRKAWLISAKSKSAELVNVSEVPEITFTASFNFLDFRGYRTVSIALDKEQWATNGWTPFDLAVHEMFHHVGQKKWIKSGAQRGTLVPLDHRPRYIRSEILNEMIKSFKHPSRLNNAADWYALWSGSYPHEVTSTTDGYEGTAQYVQFISSLLSKKSCAMTKAQLEAEVVLRLNEFEYAAGRELDDEGYKLGALAGLILDRLGIKWKSSMPRGTTPLAILLKNRSKGAPVANPQIESEFMAAFQGLNSVIDKWRLPFETRLSSFEQVRVGVPVDWIKGSYSPKGFYIPASDPKKVYTPFARKHEFVSGDGQWITVEENVVGMESDDISYCKNTYWYFLVPREQIIQDGANHRIETNDVSFNLNGFYEMGKDGFTYLCVGAK